MNKYRFNNLIKAYSQGTITVYEKSEPYYDMEQGGKYVEGETTERVIQGAIVPLTTKELMLTEGGAYSKDTVKLYCYEFLELMTEIKYINNNGKVFHYKVVDFKDYSDYNDKLVIYTLRRLNSEDTAD